MPPSVWDCIESHARDDFFQYPHPLEFPRPWTNDHPVLKIGDHSLCLLDAIPGGRPGTAILFLEQQLKREFIQYCWGVWTDYTPRVSHGRTMFQQERPSQVTQVDWDASPPVLSEDLNTSLIYRYLVAHANDLDIYGPGNALFLSLIALVGLHLSKPPLNEPFFTGLFTPWLGDDAIKLRYYSDRHHTKDGLKVEIRLLWSRLRSEVDEQRMTLRWMPRFVKQHLDTQQTGLKSALNELVERFELNFQELELAEIRLRDHIAIQSSQQSTNMAQASIRESKRVMLLTALAFIFVPFSMACSIYEMNVQEINETGHSITAFVITAVAICATALALWAAATSFQSFKSKRGEAWREKIFINRSFVDNVMGMGLWNTLQGQWYERFS